MLVWRTGHTNPERKRGDGRRKLHFSLRVGMLAVALAVRNEGLTAQVGALSRLYILRDHPEGLIALHMERLTATLLNVAQPRISPVLLPAAKRRRDGQVRHEAPQFSRVLRPEQRYTAVNVHVAVAECSERLAWLNRSMRRRGLESGGRLLRHVGDYEVLPARVDSAAADQDRMRVRRNLVHRRRRSQNHPVDSRRADARRIHRVGRGTALLVEGVPAPAVRRGRGEDIAAGVLQLDGHAGHPRLHRTAAATRRGQATPFR